MSRYHRITPLSEPADTRELDPQGRVTVAFTALAYKTASETFLLEVAKVLQVAGVGVPNVSIFGSSGSTIPKSGTIITLEDDGGSGPVYVHNQKAPAYHRPAVMVTAHAATYSDANAKAWAAYNALARVKNETVTVP